MRLEHLQPARALHACQNWLYRKGFRGKTMPDYSDYRVIALHLGEELLVEFISHIVSKTA